MMCFKEIILINHNLFELIFIPITFLIVTDVNHRHILFRNKCCYKEFNVEYINELVR
jgi:hypothetical protein